MAAIVSSGMSWFLSDFDEKKSYQIVACILLTDFTQWRIRYIYSLYYDFSMFSCSKSYPER